MPAAAPASMVKFWAELKKPLPAPSRQIVGFGGLRSIAATEFVAAGGGCSNNSAAVPLSEVIGAKMSILRILDFEDVFIG